MTKWKRMKRRQERKRMQEEERKQSTEQEPTLVEETHEDVQISQKNENTETTTNTPKFVISGVKYAYLIVCFALMSGIFYPLVTGEKWDQSSFDPNYKSLTLKDFEPYVRKIFSRIPYSN